MADRLRTGLRAPDFVLPAEGGAATRFYGMAGGQPLALVFEGDDLVVQPARDLVEGRTDDATRFGGAAQVRDQLGVEAGTVVVLDANLRVLGDAHPDDDGPVAQQVAAILAPLPAHDDVVVSAQAPVLLVPDVLTPVECEWLQTMWADSGAEETGVETTVEQGRAEVRNVKAKRRRDLVIGDAEITNRIAHAVGNAVMSEIRRAFHYRATRFEGFKVGCYDEGSAGFFSAHRDNLSPTTLHRRFALSLNLNDGYEGGEVRFPEFGPMRYRPPAGGALIFSGSLLHEVLPVTRGRRFVLLSFLWGDDVTRRT